MRKSALIGAKNLGFFEIDFLRTSFMDGPLANTYIEIIMLLLYSKFYVKAGL